MKKRQRKKRNILRGKILLGLGAMTFIMYGFLITTTTVDTAQAKKVDAHIQSLETEIAELEYRYYQSVEGVKYDHIFEQGYLEPETIAFVESSETTSLVSREYNRNSL